MPTYALTIGGVAKSIRPGSLRITETINGRNTMAFHVLSLDASYRPAMNAEVIYTEDATRLFGGYIDVPSEEGVTPPAGAPSNNRVAVVDYNALPDRRYVTATIPAGTLKAALIVLTTYLSTYGVTLHSGQVDGPAVPELTYNLRLLRECLDELSTLTGYIWEITYDKLLRMIQPGSSAAPFNVVPASDPTTVLGDITVESVRNDYANRIIVLAGTGLRDITDISTGDGSNRVFPLSVTLAGFPSVSVNGVHKTCGTYGEDTEYEWTYRASDNAIVQLADAPPGTSNSPLIVGDALVVEYSGQHPYIVQADDAGEQATNGLWERVIEEPNVWDRDVAQALADAYLTRAVTTFKSVEYHTRRTDISPGQTQTITVPDRNLSGTFLVTDVEVTDTPDHQFQRRVRAVGGTTVPSSWRDVYRGWSGSVSGPSSPATIGSSGSSARLSSPAYLGGSRQIAIAKAPAAWAPVVDYVPFTAPASFGGRVRATIWARNGSVSVTARLYNVTDSAVVAASSAVTSTTPTEVTFLVGLTAGKTYRLEITSSASGEGVYGIGVMESA